MTNRGEAASGSRRNAAYDRSLQRISARRVYEDAITAVFASDASGEEKSSKYWQYQVGMQTITDEQSLPGLSEAAAGF